MIPITRPSLPDFEEYLVLLRDIWESRMLSNFGKYAKLLEDKANNYLGTKQARVLSNCDTGLILALAMHDIPEGHEIAVASYTFNSTINSILWNKLVPHFCDIEIGSFNIDPFHVEEVIHRGAKGILATHVFGNPCDIDHLRNIAEEYKVPLIFDAAHALGSQYQGGNIGTFGDVEVFSLSGTKLVTSAEGGIICCKDPEKCRQIEYRRNYGFLYDYDSQFFGMNAKISELNAALGCLNFDQIEQAISRREEIVVRYVKNLAEVEGIGFQQVGAANRSAIKDFGIVTPYGRDELAARLGNMGVQTKKYFFPCHRMQAFSGFAKDQLPYTDNLYANILCLPIFNEMTDAEVDQVSEIIVMNYKHTKR